MRIAKSLSWRKKSYKKENHTHTDMHNGKKERIITRTTITILLKTTKLLQTTTNYESQSTYHNKEKKSPHCERSIVASGSLLPSNRVQQREIVFCLVSNPPTTRNRSETERLTWKWERKKSTKILANLLHLSIWIYIREQKRKETRDITHTHIHSHTRI